MNGVAGGASFDIGHNRETIVLVFPCETVRAFGAIDWNHINIAGLVTNAMRLEGSHTFAEVAGTALVGTVAPLPLIKLRNDLDTNRMIRGQ